MCDVCKDKASITFLKSKKNHRDAYGNLTYLMLAGHRCPWNDNKMYVTDRDRNLYIELRKEIQRYALPGLAGKYRNSEYGDYVYVRAKGYVLMNAFNRYIVFEL